MKTWVAIIFGALLTWWANPEPDITGYYLYHGRASGQYDITNWTTGSNFIIRDLVFGQCYWFAVSAVNDSGLESDLSEEVFWPPIVYQVICSVEASSDQVTWLPMQTFAIQVTNDSPRMFYRAKLLLREP